MEKNLFRIKSSSEKPVNKSNLNMWPRLPQKFSNDYACRTKMPALKWSERIN